MSPLHPYRPGKDHQAQQQRLNLQVCVAAGTIDIIQNFFDYSTYITEDKLITESGIYPNPVIGETYLELYRSYDILEVYNFNGSMIFRLNVTGMDIYTVEAACFYPGIYMYRTISYKGQRKSGKFVVN